MWQPTWHIGGIKINIIIPSLVFSIQHLTAKTILFKYQNVMGYIVTFKTLWAKLKYGVKLGTKYVIYFFKIYWKWTYFIVFGCNIKIDGKNNLHSAHTNRSFEMRERKWMKNNNLKIFILFLCLGVLRREWKVHYFVSEFKWEGMKWIKRNAYTNINFK